VSGATGAAGTQVRSNLGTASGANLGAAAHPATGAGITAGAGTAGNARIGGAAGINADSGIRTALRPNIGAAAGAAGVAGTHPFRANWHGLNAQQTAAIHANMRNALRANVANNIAARTGANVGMNSWIQNNPQRLAVWSGWANPIRSGFYAGGSPFFGGSPFYTGNFWSGRNLLGLGLAGAGLPGLGSAVAGYPMGMGMGWGYSPWLGYQPWNYWWSNPGWNGLTGYMSGYGFNQPYFYDYGAGGNVVYTGNQVLVNGQDVGTPAEYAQTAAELAAVDPATIAQSDPKDWMPLGTFSLATSQDEANPPRVIQLAINKEGLISGTVFNRNSDKLYTVQGRVDKDTQRVAFTIGDHTNTVLETGLFNLTQEQTPVLVHYGPEKTATYLMARLPAPETGTQSTQTANTSDALPGINR
jgi:hypothetical protein